MGRRADGLGESHELPTVPDSIATARSIVLAVGSGLPQGVRDDAALLVSELMSNTVRHGGETAVLTARLHEGLLTITVHDDGVDMPTMQETAPDLSATSGRGLQIIDRVADRWGVEADDDGVGKTVWFQLRAEPAVEVATGAARVSAGSTPDDVRSDKTSASAGEREDRSTWS